MKLLLNEIVKAPERIKLEEIYKTDKKLAGIIYRNSPHSSYSDEHTIIDWEDGALSLRHQYGYFRISRTDKAYFTKTTLAEIIIRNNKIWFKSGLRIVQCNWYCVPEKFKGFMLGKFPWLRFVKENKILHNVTFNLIISHKLYSLSDCLRYIYKCNLPTAQLISKWTDAYDQQHWKRWAKTKVLDNLNNLNEELICDANKWNLFHDAVKLADILRKKINCAWSYKRLKQEHDEWSKEITEIVANATNKALNILPEYKKFIEVCPDAILLEDSKSLAFEGRKQRHCVASYVSSVDSGRSAIFHIKGYTLELGKNGDCLVIRQFKGFGNSNPPEELKNEVVTALEKLQGTAKMESYTDFLI